MTTAPKKKLIEVSLPLERINFESAREKKSIRKGHPLMIHLYWARRPLAAARAVLWSQLVDDPSARPEEFPTKELQDAERARLLGILEELVVWENLRSTELLDRAREEIRKSNDGELPAVLDPFAGGGTIPLEAQRLGLEAHASDLNPVSVLINKSLIEIPPRFANRPPVSARAARRTTSWRGAEGLAEDVRKYGELLLELAHERIGHLYPKVTAPGGTQHSVIAWVWARTVISPNPANPVETPLVNSWWLSKKKGTEAYIHPVITGNSVRYEVRTDRLGPSKENDGTRSRRGAVSLTDGTPISSDYIKSEGVAGRMGAKLIAVVAEGDRGRLYLAPDAVQEATAQVPRPLDVPDDLLPYDPRNVWTPPYGLTRFSDLFTNRQLVALTTLSDLVAEVRERVLTDALETGMSEGMRLDDGGDGASAYADAVATYLGMAVSRQANSTSSVCGWDNSLQKIRNVFSRQSISMAWDFAEVNIFSSWSGGFSTQIDGMADAIGNLPASAIAEVRQLNASTREYTNLVISTDPPYYDNIGYSNLSDFFYVWLRRSLHDIQRGTLSTMLSPKSEELVADPYRHNGKEGAERFFVDGFNQVFQRIRQSANTSVPLTVYYAYKQQDSSGDGTSSTGWHTLLDGLIQTGWEITATWPMRTEMSDRMIGSNANALASSIVLACRPRPTHAEATTRRAFVATLKAALPEALRTLIQGSIAPVDLAQAAIGPGIAVFSRFSRVREADGSDMSVKDALLLINSTLDEVIGEQESDFDPDTRFSVKWYRQYGWERENSGIADQLARSSDTSIGALERGGIFEAKGGKARLLSPSQLEGEWDAEADDRVSVWEATVRLAAVMDKDGADKVAELLPGVQTKVNLDAVKELGFLLFHEAEKKHDTKDAILFNGLVSAWGDVTEQARKQESRPQRGTQQAFDFEDED